MIKVNITVPEYKEDLQPVITKSLWQATTLVRGRASLNAPYKSGTLRRSLVEKVSGNEGTVGTNVVYARIHEYGGIIVPKKGKFLVFNDGTRKVFAKRVQIKARPYLGPALEDSKEKITKIFADNINEELGRNK